MLHTTCEEVMQKRIGQETVVRSTVRNDSLNIAIDLGMMAISMNRAIAKHYLRNISGLDQYNKIIDGTGQEP